MSSRSFQRLMFGCIFMLWITAILYLMQGSSKILSPGMDTTLKMMQELQKQNIQLKQLADQMNKITMEDDGGLLSEKNIESHLEKVKLKLKECSKNFNVLLSKSNDSNMVKTNTHAEEAPSRNHELWSRYIYNNVQELWYFIRNEISNLKSDENSKHLIREIRQQKNAALVDIEILLNENEAWRKREAQDLQNIVQKRIQYMQNPPDCKTAKKLLCNINKGCGFGCQIHHVTFCFLIAFGTKRTLILKSSNWRYSKEGFESIFLPLSETCVDGGGATSTIWSNEERTKDTQVVSVGIVDSMPQRPPYLPLTIPKDLAPRLIRFHGNPAVWWLSQFVRYLVRLQPDLVKGIEKFKQQINFTVPIVGIHVRRTDKVGSEAALHNIEEYMEHVDSWYEKEDMKRQRMKKPKLNGPRKVYVATDDNTVFREASTRYPAYKFLNDPSISQSASVGKRYSKEGLVGVITDIMLLSECDYIVGTFSSQVSRMAYELMQTRHADATTFAQSLDDIFYFGGQSAHQERVIYDHKPKDGANSLTLEAGDIIGIAGNHWDGFSKGKLAKNGKVGLYPSYKTEDIINIVDFPDLSEANNIKLNHEFLIR